MLILQRGTYRQSFRPIMWVYAVTSIAKTLQLQRSTELSQLQWYSVAIAIDYVVPRARQQANLWPTAQQRSKGLNWRRFAQNCRLYRACHPVSKVV